MTFASRVAASQRWGDPLAKRLQPLINRAVSAPLVDTVSALSGDDELGAACGLEACRRRDRGRGRCHE